MNECCEKMKKWAPFFLRLGLGVVFVYHGYGKVFGKPGLGTSWNPMGMPPIEQALVAWGEFLWFLTPIAASGIIVIMVGAIVTVTGKHGFGMMHSGFEYNYVLIMMCLSLIASGSGPLSVGCGCKCKKE